MAHAGKVCGVAFSPDSKTVLTGSHDRTTRLWDASTGRPLGQPVLHHSEVWAVAISPTGKTALTGGADGYAQEWDLGSWKPAGPALQHRGCVERVAYSRDGRLLLTASHDHTGRMWQAATGKPVGPPLKHDDQVRALAVSPDNRLVATGSMDKTVRLWSMPTPIDGDIQQIVSWVERVTGTELDESGSIRVLDPDAWARRSGSPDESGAGQPEGSTSPADLVRNLTERGKWDEAAQRVEELLAQQPDEIRVLTLAASFYSHLTAHRENGSLLAEKAYCRAQMLYEKLLGREPNNFEHVNNLADLVLENRPAVAWTVLEPTAMKSAAGATLTRQADGSILVSGVNPLNDTYTVEVKNPLKGVTTLRLEALPDSSLPNWGPGRELGQPNRAGGNFHLTEISLLAASLETPARSIPLTQAAGHQRREAGISILEGPHGAIDGSHATRWDIHPNLGRASSAQFQLAIPTDETKLIIRLDFQDPIWKQATAGRFRLSATTQPNVVRDENLYALAGMSSPWARLGIAYLLHVDLAAAWSTFEKAVASSAKPQDRVLLAILREQLGQPVPTAEVAALGQALVRLPPGDVHWFLLERGLDLLSRCLTREPKVSLYLMRHQLLTRMGRRKEAAMDMARALELDPQRPLGRQDASAHFWAAQFWQRLGRNDRTTSHLEMASRLDPVAARTPLIGHAFLGGPGRWRIDGQELVQEAQVDAACWLSFGDPTWTDYDLEVEAMRSQGVEGFSVGFRMLQDMNMSFATLGGGTNRFHAIVWHIGGRPVFAAPGTRPGTITTGQWYRVKVVARGPSIRVFLDNEKILEHANSPFLQGIVGVRSWNTANRFRNIKVTAPDGKILFEGLPRIHHPPAGEVWPALP